MKTRTAFTASMLALASFAVAQEQQPQRPQRVPRETLTASVAGKGVEIAYGRPQLKGRALADLLKQLPADRIWRAGENEVTTFSTEGPLAIGGKPVAAGKYSLYIHIPESGDWSLVLNTDPGIPLKQIFPQAPPNRAEALWPRLDGYDKVKDKEVVRAAMKKAPAPATPVEAFTATLAAAKSGAVLTMSWGQEAWTLELLPGK
jgi:hypothetical protein